MYDFYNENKILSENFNFQLIHEYKKIGVACSGGMDSIALLKVLSDYRMEHQFQLFAVHVDHDLRETSKADSDFVHAFCKSLQIPVFYKKVKVKAIAKRRKLGIEECAREERYKFFSQLIEERRLDAVALAHHNQDDVETMLLNLSRGCFMNGLAGIKEKRENYIRPMLYVKKSEIESYIAKNNLEYVIDETNDDTAYARNYVRKEILPRLLERFPNFEDSYMSLKKSIATDEEHFAKAVDKIVILSDGEAKIRVRDIAFDEAVAKRAYLRCIAYLGVQSGVYKSHLDNIHSLLNKKSGKHAQVVDGICCFKDYEYLTFERNYPYFYEEFSIKLGELKTGDYTLLVETADVVRPTINDCFIDADKLPATAVLRKRKEGDIFLRTSGSKKLKSYLIDRKVPQRYRDDLFVVADGKYVHAVVGMECGKELLVTSDTKNIYKITHRRIYH